MKFYIAYGSNLNVQQMKRRCPDAVKVGEFLLTNARLVFRGVADVESCEGQSVPCGLWRISPRDELALDRYEGVDHGLYSKNEAIKLQVGGKKVTALIYLMNSEGIYPPSQMYVDTIRQGYQDFGLNESFLDEAIAQSFEEKAPDRQTTRRRMKQVKNGQKLTANTKYEVV